MEPNRFQLEGATLRELKARILAEHGPEATIVAAERVTVGGIRGFFARQHYEVTVEMPARRPLHARDSVALPTRLGIAALLDDADEAEARAHDPAAADRLSTGSDRFAALMDELTFATGGTPPAAAKARVAPAVLAGAGDLVLVVGQADDALAAARSLVLAVGSGEVRVGGALPGEGNERVDDRRGALAARAGGVAQGHGIVVAFALGRGAQPAGDLARQVASLGAMEPDQTWLVVDASRKADDTARWVRAVSDAVPIDAVVAVGRELTASPATVDDLGFPVRWLGRPAPGPSR
ncbi:hypothetical protein SAMN05216282_102103 [Cryobacterium psychrotolerans]|uniref:Uncharacterized protein n=1 Tax=Cryobacterium psychrotolerans TaxID=386301 RepID=A0A1G8YCX5_9MICO|nr:MULTISPECIES: hypothetical protein [Cryobacterium]TFD49179.1 hypothetical protein E3T33_00645 [Cryobacterium sp. TMT1-2-1]TFD90939.1 hypothetical protein E3T56_00630 [Cryobacterium psychrotolerans]SDK00576.1 hypothetical protein SAMN05216282_102103 [Cryobacterium psychrotolerans]